MPHSRALLIAAFGASVLSAAMAQELTPPAIGPSPNLHQPQKNWLPTISWAPVEQWADGRKPKAAPGLAVNAFAQGLKHPRWIYVLPNGDVLVAESATLPSPSWSPRALIQNFIQHRVRATVENANRISLLKDKDGDGIAEERTVFLEGLRQPFGMALIGDKFYVANTDSVVAYPYKQGDTRITAQGQKIMDLKVGHHWTRNLLASRDGSKLYVTVGSASNIAEHGLEIEEGRAAIHELDIATGKSRIFASGLRNANGMGFEPQTGVLWTVVNERDELGDELPPDYMTSVKDGGFYGWPYSYWGKHVDTRVQPQRPELVEKSITPDYALGGHTATLGLDVRRGLRPARAVQGRRIRRHAWIVEPFRAEWLQGHIRRVQRRKAEWNAGRRADGISAATTPRRRMAGRSASPSIARARCSSPTTRAMRSGALPVRKASVSASK